MCLYTSLEILYEAIFVYDGLMFYTFFAGGGGSGFQIYFFACGHILSLHTYTMCLILEYININLAYMRDVPFPSRDSSSVLMWRLHA